MSYNVIWSGRYGDPHSFPLKQGDESTRIMAPERIVVDSDDIRVARWVAECLSGWWPGQDYCYVVEEDDV